VPVSGVADLPLHGGHVPAWLARIMKRMAKAIVKIMIIEYGPIELLRRLSNPLWFQALNNAIGMDWDSSGSTTVTTAILKEILKEENIEVRIAGGKGKISLKTPKEIIIEADDIGLITSKASELIKISKLGAKVDTTLLQDGFTLYHHAIAFTKSGEWVIIQQGMNEEIRMARRYHIAWYKAGDITLEPHTGVASDIIARPLNLTKSESIKCRPVIIDLSTEKVEKIKKYIAEVNAVLKGIRALTASKLPRKIDKSLPYYRPVRLSSRLLRTLKQVYEVKPTSLSELLLDTSVGSEGIRALSLISELIYREPPPLDDSVTHPYDPFKYAFTIGGKDGIPYPVKKELAETVLKELEHIIKSSELGDKEKFRALRSLRKLAPRDYSY
jgi:hypothetical protein